MTPTAKRPSTGRSSPRSSRAADIDRWLAELGLEAVEREEREGITSWDLLLDGRRRRSVRVTLILDPALVLVAWAHYAPALGDAFRKSYRQFLRWNDELPFVKFALSSDERPVLSAELPADGLDRDRLGLTLARLLAVCDLLLEDSLHWLEPGGRPRSGEPVRVGSGSGRPGASLIERYGAELGELATPPDGEPAR
ncbi:MAG TPA: YbjN domain-containing protein [Candidatus Limnocylindrales bacterium]|jgi:hypothetical protein|nr:YbjN domain-containing protein [Candidatus Limnocylindrales bacterium]